ncbi:hypothetical protein HYH03_000187 [Edaphochlamys debaryana]|uniref:Uncharacterized protein n=1 Tax=Edaphochlamys debaryana TaxID=47281 RepID=A0A836C696_9CHLO|nr:hypothetical protein HYH03_000187 [Edaphochlamys debaryana]|eukprot:KAG2501685.1 hypothetical protein HYH03_000187 [Edaphochlamys debaryana]
MAELRTARFLELGVLIIALTACAWTTNARAVGSQRRLTQDGETVPLGNDESPCVTFNADEYSPIIGVAGTVLGYILVRSSGTTTSNNEEMLHVSVRLFNSSGLYFASSPQKDTAGNIVASTSRFLPDACPTSNRLLSQESTQASCETRSAEADFAVPAALFNCSVATEQDFERAFFLQVRVYVAPMPCSKATSVLYAGPEVSSISPGCSYSTVMGACKPSTCPGGLASRFAADGSLNPALNAQLAPAPVNDDSKVKTLVPAVVGACVGALLVAVAVAVVMMVTKRRRREQLLPRGRGKRSHSAALRAEGEFSEDEFELYTNEDFDADGTGHAGNRRFDSSAMPTNMRTMGQDRGGSLYWGAGSYAQVPDKRRSMRRDSNYSALGSPRSKHQPRTPRTPNAGSAPRSPTAQQAPHSPSIRFAGSGAGRDTPHGTGRLPAPASGRYMELEGAPGGASGRFPPAAAPASPARLATTSARRGDMEQALMSGDSIFGRPPSKRHHADPRGPEFSSPQPLGRSRFETSSPSRLGPAPQGPPMGDATASPRPYGDASNSPTPYGAHPTTSRPPAQRPALQPSDRLGMAGLPDTTQAALGTAASPARSIKIPSTYEDVMLGVGVGVGLSPGISPTASPRHTAPQRARPAPQAPAPPPPIGVHAPDSPDLLTSASSPRRADGEPSYPWGAGAYAASSDASRLPAGAMVPPSDFATSSAAAPGQEAHVGLLMDPGSASSPDASSSVAPAGGNWRGPSGRPAPSRLGRSQQAGGPLTDDEANAGNSSPPCVGIIVEDEPGSGPSTVAMLGGRSGNRLAAAAASVAEAIRARAPRSAAPEVLGSPGPGSPARRTEVELGSPAELPPHGHGGVVGAPEADSPGLLARVARAVQRNGLSPSRLNTTGQRPHPSGSSVNF